METILFLIACLSLLLWAYLIFLHGRFWQADAQLDPGRREPASWPAVAILVPAGTDTDALEEALPGLLGQSYPGAFHVVVIDEYGGSGVADAAYGAARAAGAAERLSVLAVGAPPKGWSRRAWALAQAQEHAATTLPGTRYLWLTETWATQGSRSLRGLVAKAETDRCDLVSLLPFSPCETAWDRLLAPAFAFFFQAFHPFSRVNDPQHPAAVAAPGCTLVALDPLRTAGGFAAVKTVPAPEAALASAIKAVSRQAGRGIWLGLGEESVAIRADDGWRALADATRASVAARLRGAPLHFAADTLAMALACLAPPLVFLCALVAGLFLDIDQYLLTFVTILLACAAWAAMAVAAWPTYSLYDLEEWHTLTVPLAAAVQILLTIALLPGLRGRAARPGQAAAGVTKAAQPPSGAVKIEPRLDVPPPAAGARPAEPPARKAATGGHALRQRIARS